MSIVEFNYIESGLWFLIAAVLLVAAFKQWASGPYFTVCAVSFVSFIAFGISDIIEAQTGAWWRPFWLFILKAVCVATFIICYAWYKHKAVKFVPAYIMRGLHRTADALLWRPFMAELKSFEKL